MKTKVEFIYDEDSAKWEVMVYGVADEIEARQAFSAVVLSVMQLDPNLLKHTIIKKVKCGFYITPAVY